MEDNGKINPDEYAVVPIDDSLDLHTFAPEDVRDVIEEYLFQCSIKGLSQVRLIHGRGTGQLRATVQVLLMRSSYVLGFSDAPQEAGGWGATIVRLKPNAPVDAR